MRIQSHLDLGVNLRPHQRRAASALAGGEALARLAEDQRAIEIARGEKLGPALARAAGRAGLTGAAAEGWRGELRAAAATRMWLAAAAGDLVAILGEAGIPFAPIKGWDLGRRVYPSPEERPTSDLDLLLPPDRLDPALAALGAAGFRLLQTGKRAERYLREEGYAAALKAPAGQLVELHFRLWGSAPADLAAALLAAAAADPDLGQTARAIRLEHAYLLAAFHIFLDPPPRPAGAFRDLALLAAKNLDAAFLEEETRRFGLALPVGLASAAAGELFGDESCRALAARLRPTLRWPEQRVPWDADCGSRQLFLARLLAGRPSRHGWRLLWRRFWPHAGIVEAATPEGRSWARRRLWYLWNHWRGKTGPGEQR
jgi:hypothetical protein